MRSGILRAPVRGLSILGCAGVVAALSVGPVSAQEDMGARADWRQTQARSVDGMREKFVLLSRAFPEDLYDWRPQEGVRSVREVFTLIAAGAAAVPTGWGFEPLSGAEVSFRLESERVSAMSPQQLGDWLDQSLAHYGSLIANVDESDMARTATLGGNKVSAAEALILLADDFHEHLGQLIAYARTNGVVPPWSRRGM